MKSVIKKILFLYFLLVVIKIIMSYFIKTPTIFADSYLYMKGARSLWLLKEYSVHGLPIFQYPPLYSLVLSISYIFHDMNLVYFLMKIINSFLSTLIIIPTYLLSKEFLSKRKAILIALIVGILSHNLLISNYIMSENLFYPLFLFEIYFLYKFFTTYKYKWSFLSGLFLGLCFLTRVVSLILIPTIFVISCILIYSNLKQKNNKEIISFLKKSLILIFGFILIILPWVIRNSLLSNSFKILGGYSSKHAVFGFSVKAGLSELGLSTSKLILIAIFGFLHWLIVHIGIIFLGMLIIFPLLYFYFIKNYKKCEYNLKIFSLVSSVSIFFSVLLATIFSALYFISYNKTLIWWLPGVPVTRYIEFVFPLIIIGGFLYKKQFKYIAIKRKDILIISLLLILSFQLIFFSSFLFPIMNTSITYIGVLSLIINFLLNKPFNYLLFILILGIIPFLVSFIFKKLSFKQFIYLFICFLLVNSSISYAATVYSSNIWYNSEQIKLSLWLKDTLKKNESVIIDIRKYSEYPYSNVLSKDNQTNLYIGYPEDLHHSATIIGYLVNNPIYIKNIENVTYKGYIVTMHSLDRKPIKTVTVENKKIYVYKIDISSY